MKQNFRLVFFIWLRVDRNILSTTSRCLFDLFINQHRLIRFCWSQESLRKNWTSDFPANFLKTHPSSRNLRRGFRGSSEAARFSGVNRGVVVVNRLRRGLGRGVRARVRGHPTKVRRLARLLALGNNMVFARVCAHCAFHPIIITAIDPARI